jgi:trigger factor
MGKRVGDTVSFDKSYDEEAKNEAFRGKNVHHEVTVKEIRVQEKPELNDELAKSAGGWETVEAMREAISTDIRRHREMEAMRLKKNQVGDRLIATHEMEVPESMVEEELGKSLNNYARFLASQGVDLEKAELDWRKVAEEFRPEAIKRVKRALILDEIAKVEGIQAGDVEVDAEIRRATSEQDRDFAEVKHRLRHDGGYEELRASLAREKAIDFVLHEARTK